MLVYHQIKDVGTRMAKIRAPIFAEETAEYLIRKI
jgi:hypothetical protein